MREVTDSDQIYNGLEPGERPIILDVDDAKTIARALIVLNKSLVAEYEKIQNTPDVSELIVAAAHKQYNELTQTGSNLHVQLAQIFPELTQP